MNTEKQRSFGEIARPERRRLLATLRDVRITSVAMLLLIHA